MSAFSWDAFRAVPIVAILRGFNLDRIRPLVEAVRSGGLTTIEITMNTPGAGDQIRAAREAAAGRLNVGAGTVTDLRRLEEAVDAGASFIVTPTVEPSVIIECVRRKIPVFPGALSPTEVATANEHGARMIKVFPADGPGPVHVRRLKELFPEIPLLATGGVDLATLPEYRRAGADGYGVGSPLFDPTRIASGDWGWLEQRCRAFRDASTG